MAANGTNDERGERIASEMARLNLASLGHEVDLAMSTQTVSDVPNDFEETFPDETWLAAVAILASDEGVPRDAAAQYVTMNADALLAVRRGAERVSAAEIAQYLATKYPG